MTKNTSKKTKGVLMSDKYISESGVQGGNVLSDHISLLSFIIGIPFLIIGVITLIGIFFNFGFQKNAAIIIGAFLVSIIGLLLVIGGYFIYKNKQVKN